MPKISEVSTTDPTAARARDFSSDTTPFLGGDHEPPKYEPWLGVTLLTFVPGSLVFFLPHAILVRTLIPICISMAVFFFAGMGMLIRDWRARRITESS